LLRNPPLGSPRSAPASTGCGTSPRRGLPADRAHRGPPPRPACAWGGFGL